MGNCLSSKEAGAHKQSPALPPAEAVGANHHHVAAHGDPEHTTGPELPDSKDTCKSQRIEESCRVAKQHINPVSSTTPSPAGTGLDAQHTSTPPSSTTACSETAVHVAAHLSEESKRRSTAAPQVDTNSVCVSGATGTRVPGGCCSLERDLLPSGDSGAPPGNELLYPAAALEAGTKGLPHDHIRFGCARAANEEDRMATVRALRHMDVSACTEIDALLKVIVSIWQAPSACTTLLDSDHVWICNGTESMPACHAPWRIAMCPWTLMDRTAVTLAVDNLGQDARFAQSVHCSAGTKAYLTAPLIASNGHRLGTVCFTDVQPRKFNAGDCRLMNNLAELASRELERHVNLPARLHRIKQVRRAQKVNLLLEGAAGVVVGDNAAPSSVFERSATAVSSTTRAASSINTARTRSGLPAHLLLDDDDDDDVESEEDLQQLAKAFGRSNYVRDVDAAVGACIILVDTSVEGWRIMYASPTWNQLTGGDRDADTGRTLNEVLVDMTVNCAALASGTNAYSGAYCSSAHATAATNVSTTSGGGPAVNATASAPPAVQTPAKGNKDGSPLESGSGFSGACTPVAMAAASSSHARIFSFSAAGGSDQLQFPSQQSVQSVQMHSRASQRLGGGIGAGARMLTDDVVWAGLQKDAAAGKHFVTARLMHRFAALPANSGAPQAFYLAFSPAALSELDADTAPLGVPTSVPQGVAKEHTRYYFARVHKAASPPHNSAALLSPLLTATAGTRRLSPAMQMSPIVGLKDLIKGLEVGQVLGQGSYGTVYAGCWHGARVAIKVQDLHLRNDEERAKADQEVALGSSMRHTNLVATLAHASALLERPNDAPDSIMMSWQLAMPVGWAEAASTNGNSGTMERSSVHSGELQQGEGDAKQADSSGMPAFVPVFGGHGFATPGNDDEAGSSAGRRAADGSAGRQAGGMPVGKESHMQQNPGLADAAAASASTRSGSSSHHAISAIGLVHDGSGNNDTQPSCSGPSLTGREVPELGLGRLPAAVKAPSPSRSGMETSGGDNPGLKSAFPAVADSATGPSVWGAVVSPRSPRPTGVAGGSTHPAIRAASGRVHNWEGFDGFEGFTRAQSGVVPTLGPLSREALAAASAAVRVGAALSHPNTNLPTTAGSTAGADEQLHRTASLGDQAMAASYSAAASGPVRNASVVEHCHGMDPCLSVQPMLLCPTTHEAAGAAAVMQDVRVSLEATAAPTVSSSSMATAPTAMVSMSSAATGTQNLTSNNANGTTFTTNVNTSAAMHSPHWVVVGDLAGITDKDELAAALTGVADVHASACTASSAYAADVVDHQFLSPTHRSAQNGINLRDQQVQRQGASVERRGLGSERAAGGAAAEAASGLEPQNQLAVKGESAAADEASMPTYPLHVRVWMIMDFMDHGNLQEAIDRGWLRVGRGAPVISPGTGGSGHHGSKLGPINPRAVLATAMEVASALEYLHGAGVVHGDLSAVNVLLCKVDLDNDPTERGFTAKVSDFGMSVMLEPAQAAVKTGTYGTLTHMAPEVLATNMLSRQADMYSFGVLLWQMSTGSRPWAGLSHVQLTMEVGVHKRCLQFPDWVDPALRALGQACLAAAPQDRPSATQAQSVLTDMYNAAVDVSSCAPEPAPSQQATSPRMAGPRSFGF